MRTTGREDDFVAKMYFTDDIDGGIELDWCLRWKREILGWNDGMAAGRVDGYGGGKKEESFASLWNRDCVRMHLLFFLSKTILLSIFFLPIASMFFLI